MQFPRSLFQEGSYLSLTVLGTLTPTQSLSKYFYHWNKDYCIQCCNYLISPFDRFNLYIWMLRTGKYYNMYKMPNMSRQSWYANKERRKAEGEVWDRNLSNCYLGCYSFETDLSQLLRHVTGDSFLSRTIESNLPLATRQPFPSLSGNEEPLNSSRRLHKQEIRHNS